MSVEYGVGTLIGAVRAARIAPVSREMILNYIAQHSLGLPKSYVGLTGCLVARQVRRRYTQRSQRSHRWEARPREVRHSISRNHRPPRASRCKDSHSNRFASYSASSRAYCLARFAFPWFMTSATHHQTNSAHNLPTSDHGHDEMERVRCALHRWLGGWDRGSHGASFRRGADQAFERPAVGAATPRDRCPVRADRARTESRQAGGRRTVERRSKGITVASVPVGLSSWLSIVPHSRQISRLPPTRRHEEDSTCAAGSIE